MEARVQALEERVKVLEALVARQAPPARPPTPFPATPFPPRPSAPAGPPKPPLDLEALLGGRVLASVGGVAVFLAAVFFLVTALRDGWIDEPTRVVLAFLGSTLLFLTGLWLYERKGQTEAALATVAASLAALYASDTAATSVYHLVSPAAGLAVGAVIAVGGTVIAVRWSSQLVAAIGIVGALLAPPLVDAGTSTSSLAFMAIALVGAVGVLVWRRWSWLALAAYVVSAPQAAIWLEGEREDHLGRALVVTGLFWALYLVAALGYELRVPTAALRLSSASLLFTNAAATAASGWFMLHDERNGFGATAWVIGVAVAHVAVGVASLRGRISNEIGMLLSAVGSALAAVGLALALDGPALVAGWAAEGLLLAFVASRTRDRRGYLGSAAFLALAAAHALLVEAPPRALAYGVDSVGAAVVGLVIVGAAIAVTSILLAKDGREEEAAILRGLAAAFAVYLGSVVVVELAGSDPTRVTQTPQLALSAFWAVLGFVALVAGLVRDVKPLRLAGLGLLALAVGKVFVVDLAALESIWRVASFLALGLLLLAGAFAYQRMRAGERT
jgi:uncharacterized membrane protein